MPIGLDNALQIAKSGLFLNQYRLNVISQNIANADNTEYSRRVVNEEASPSIKNISPGSIGTGVNVKEVKRLVDKFLEMAINQNNSEIGKFEISDKYLTQIEGIFNDLKNSGLSQALEGFWNSWSDLSNNPSEYPERITVLSKANNLSKIFQNLYNEITSVENGINDEIKNIVLKVNDIIQKISSLNKQIFEIETNPNNHANDLRDKRDSLVKELSKYLDIKYVEENNSYIIYTANGRTLVDGVNYAKLGVKPNELNSNFYNIYYINSKGISEDITDNLNEGELKGLIDVRKNFIEKYKNILGKIANALITQVNIIHSQGTGLKRFKRVESEIQINNPDLPFDFEELRNSVNSGHLGIVVYDSNGNPVEFKDIIIGSPESLDSDINTANELKDYINTNFSHLHAEFVNNHLKIESDQNYSFSISQDTSKILSALGINIFFSGDKYNLQQNINIVASEANGNLTHINYVNVYDKTKLTNHEYKITNNGSNVTITDLSTGELLSPDKYRITDDNNRITIKFDGIKLQLNSDTWNGNNTYYIKNATTIGVIDDDAVNTHTYQVNFSNGLNSISITDLDEKRTLSDNEYEILNITTGSQNFKVIKIKTSGIYVTIPENTYGIVEIRPEITGAKNIHTAIDDEHLDLINAGNVNSITFDDSEAEVKVKSIDVTDFTKLKRVKYTIVANGGGNYSITDENGNTITPSAQGNDFVEFDGIRINFKSNTNAGDMYTVNGNLLDFSEGNNKIALQIADLRDKKVMNNNSQTITQSYSNLLSTIGLDKMHMKNRLEALKTTHESLMKQRDSISGVSIDEELTNLIQTQHAYIASAKLITVVDKLTQYLLNSI